MNSNEPAVGLNVVGSNLHAPALATQESYEVVAVTNNTKSTPVTPLLNDLGIVTVPHYPLKNNLDDGYTFMAAFKNPVAAFTNLFSMKSAYYYDA